MAIDICTHKQEANQIERAVCLGGVRQIEELFVEAYNKFDEKHKVVKVINEQGNLLTFWRNDLGMDAALKQCDCMMHYDRVEIPKI